MLATKGCDASAVMRAFLGQVLRGKQNDLCVLAVRFTDRARNLLLGEFLSAQLI